MTLLGTALRASARALAVWVCNALHHINVAKPKLGQPYTRRNPSPKPPCTVRPWSVWSRVCSCRRCHRLQSRTSSSGSKRHRVKIGAAGKVKGQTTPACCFACDVVNEEHPQPSGTASGTASGRESGKVCWCCRRLQVITMVVVVIVVVVVVAIRCQRRSREPLQQRPCDALHPRPRQERGPPTR